MSVWSFGIQLESKGSKEFLKSKCALIIEGFSTDNKLFIGNGHRDTEE